MQRKLVFISGSHTGVEKESSLIRNYLVAGTAQSVHRIATGLGFRGSKWVGAIFCKISDGPWRPLQWVPGLFPVFK